MKKALMFASVASMIDQFNMDNILTLRNLGYQVDVACNFEFGSTTSQERVNEFRKELEKNHIKTYHIPVPRKINAINELIASYKSVNGLLEKNKYDIVHCHSPIGGVIARLCCRKYRKQGTRVIYTAHGFHFYKGASMLNWLIFYPIERYCARYTDVLITINKEDYNRAINRFKALKVIYVPGVGVDVKKIKIIRGDKKKYYAEFNIKDDDFLLFSAGQLSKRKNHEVLIRALAKVKIKNIKLLICGLGELEGYLRTLTKQLGVEDQVIFAGFRTDVKEVLKIADCFVFPSYQEGLSVALMEAMAAGLPVICSKIRGNSDLIINNKGGFLVEPNDIEGFGKSITKVMNDVKLRKEMGVYNGEEVEKYDKEKIIQEMTNIYLLKGMTYDK